MAGIIIITRGLCKEDKATAKFFLRWRKHSQGIIYYCCRM